MQHDFEYNSYNWRGRKADRHDDNGDSCTDIAAFMDYVFPPYTSYNPMPNKWSRCSWTDFIVAYSQIVDEDGDYCLAKSSDKITGCKNIRPAYMDDGDAIHASQFAHFDWDTGCESAKDRCDIDWFARHCKKSCGLC